MSRFSPKLKYLLIDEGAYDHEELESLKNVVAMLFLLEHTPSVEVASNLMVELARLLSDKKELQRAFLVLFNRMFWGNQINIDELYRNVQDPREVADMVERNRDRWYETLRKEGKAEGKAEGDARGASRPEIAKRMLRAGMSVSQVAEITELSEEEVQKLRDSVAH